MSVLDEVETKADFEALWQRVRAAKLATTEPGRFEELERDVLMLQVGQARIAKILAKLTGVE